MCMQKLKIVGPCIPVHHQIALGYQPNPLLLMIRKTISCSNGISNNIGLANHEKIRQSNYVSTERA